MRRATNASPATPPRRDRRLHDRAACAGHPDLPPRAWEPGDDRHLDRDLHHAAVAVCESCPVVALCAADELAGPRSVGVIRAGVYRPGGSSHSPSTAALEAIADGVAPAEARQWAAALRAG